MPADGHTDGWSEINDQTVDAAGARQTLRAQDRPEPQPPVSGPVLVGSPREAPSRLRDAALLPAQRSELPGAAGAPALHARAPDHSESSLVHAARASPASRGRQLASPDAALEGRERGSHDTRVRAPLRQRTSTR